MSKVGKPSTETRRDRPANIKQQIVEAREFEDIRLVEEHVAELRYRPGNCSREYRVVVVWKDLDVYRGQGKLFDYDCCFFYITNDFDSPAEQIVYSANQRCNQENTIEQHKNGVHALTAPLDTLDSNWAYMIMASLAWSLKAWSALLVPVSPRWQAMHDALKQRLLRMDFATYRNAIINIPAQIVRTGGKIVYRLLAWNSWQETFFRLVDRIVRFISVSRRIMMSESGCSGPPPLFSASGQKANPYEALSIRNRAWREAFALVSCLATADVPQYPALNGYDSLD